MRKIFEDSLKKDALSRVARVYKAQVRNVGRSTRRNFMRTRRFWTWPGLVGFALLLSIGVASADDISGLITTTRTIRENSRFVGDVTCMVTGAPCILFGSSHIDLRLNGFTMTGQADATTACNGASTAGEMGISTN